MNILEVLVNYLCWFISGQRLCLAEDKYIGGAGTYTRQGYIMSCLAGVVKVTSQPDKVNSIHIFQLLRSFYLV